MSDVKLNELQMALWGPPTSGKTWLLEAFGRKLFLMNEVLEEKNRFALSLYDMNRRRDVVGDGRFPEPTGDATIAQNLVKYRFVRRGLGKGFQYEASTCCHYVDILDNPGGATIQETEEEAIRESVRIQQRKAKNLILVLTKDDNLDSQEYLAKLRDLRREFNRVEGQRRIAVCITKADEIGGPGLVFSSDPQALLPLVFSDNHEQVVEFFDDLLSVEDGHDVAYFAVSASGYTGTGDPNIDPISGNLVDVDAWHPINVEEPFMWLFDRIERDRLRKSHEQQMGLFYRLFKQQMSDARLEARVSYSDMINWVRDKLPPIPM